MGGHITQFPNLSFVAFPNKRKRTKVDDFSIEQNRQSKGKLKKVQVGKDQEKAQSEKDSHSKHLFRVVRASNYHTSALCKHCWVANTRMFTINDNLLKKLYHH